MMIELFEVCTKKKFFADELIFELNLRVFNIFNLQNDGKFVI